MPSLESLTDTDAKVRMVLEGSCIYHDDSSGSEALDAWTRSRRFIADALRQDGTFLDYGCANGFLLRCLQEWSTFKLDPYGIELDPGRLAQARAMFPGLRGHFVRPDQLGVAADFPKSFGHVYWAVGDNVDFGRPEYQRWLAKVLALTDPAGRFVIGLYDTPDANRVQLDRLMSIGLWFGEIRWNEVGDGEVVAWLDFSLP